MLEFVSGLTSGIIVACVAAYFTYWLGRKDSARQIKALEDIANSQKEYILKLEAGLQQRQKMFEYQQQKDVISGLWEVYKHFDK